MGFVKDIFGIFKKWELLFIEYYQESENVYTFVFEKDANVTWKPGQHGLFHITHKSFKNPTRPFCISTVPIENKIKITTRIDEHPSDFKKAMLDLETGMTMKVNGLVGSFYLKDHCPSVFIAGGMGITPFRSMLKQIDVEALNQKIKLLYIHSSKEY